jgi:hypothetical protein
MREVLRIESDYVRFVAEKLRKGLGLSSVPKELEILANAIIFVNAFIPLRGWNLHHVPQGKILDLLVGMFMMKLGGMRKHPETWRSFDRPKAIQKREGGSK